MRSIKYILCFLLVLTSGVFLANITQAWAQSDIRLNIEDVNDAQFPQVEAFVSVTDIGGFPVKGLTQESFSLSEDGQPVPDFELSPIFNTGQPLAFVLLIDTSGSMKWGPESTPIQDAIDAGKGFVASLAPQDQVGVISFNNEVLITQDLTTDKDLVANALDTLVADGDTALYDAIYMGAEMLKARSERRVIILITDGVDSGISQYSFDDAISAAARWGIPVYPIGFGGVDQEELKRIAEFTGGSAHIKPNSTDLQSSLDTVTQNLREQYLIKYDSALQADGLEHELVLGVNFEGWSAQDTGRFVAQPGEVTVTLPDFVDGQEVAGTFLFAPETIAPAPIAQFDILIDGDALESVYAPPYEYAWDSTSITAGEYEFTFVVTDSAGNTNRASVRLVVVPPVVVKINRPATGDEVSNSVIISAEVHPTNTKIDRVEIKADGNVLETFVESPDETYETQWGLVRVNPGTHEITVVASDMHGFTTEDQVNVYLRGDGGGGAYGLVILVVVVAAAVVLIMFVIRNRRKRGQEEVLVPPPDTRATPAVLRELEGQNPGQVWGLSGSETHLGRKRDENDIHLKGRSASRRQAVVSNQGGNYYIRSLQAGNPVLVNDTPVNDQLLLQPGAIIRAGESVFKFEVQG